MADNVLPAPFPCFRPVLTGPALHRGGFCHSLKGGPLRGFCAIRTVSEQRTFIPPRLDHDHDDARRIERLTLREYLDGMEFVMDKAKAVEALIYIASKFAGVGRFHAAKILYFAERNHLRAYGRPIVGDRYIAMENGPVPSFAYDVLKGTVSPADKSLTEGALSRLEGTHYPSYVAAREPDLDFFSASDLECLDAAIEYCRPKSFGVISDETHHHSAWANADLNAPMDYEDFLDGVSQDTVDEAQVFAAYGVV